MHTRRGNIWHSWNEGLMGTFQTLRELGYLPLVQIDDQGYMRWVQGVLRAHVKGPLMQLRALLAAPFPDKATPEPGPGTLLRPL